MWQRVETLSWLEIIAKEWATKSERPRAGAEKKEGEAVQEGPELRSR
jgi:hypothetical protein